MLRLEFTTGGDFRHYVCFSSLAEAPSQGDSVINQAVQYDSRLISGVDYFNECEFFEAHEVWEDLWKDYQGPSRNFYKGLIQVAVCLHHFGNGNIRGARKLYGSSTKYLAEYQPHHEGVDLAKLLADLQNCCAEILASEEEFPKIEIVVDLIPEIHLDPPPNK